MLTHHLVPANDGGLSLGQAAIAAARLTSHEKIMCLGIPGQIVEITDRAQQLAIVEIGGVKRQVNIACIVDDNHSPEACVGDWVLVHVGFALNRLDEQDAQKTLALFDQLAAMDS